MADQDKKEIIPEDKISAPRQEIYPQQETAITPEKKENALEQKIVIDKLKREIELMELDENMKAEADKAKEKIEFLGEKEKIEHLLQIAREKGVVFAVQLAKKMNEPYLLDTFHDILAQEGFYQKLMQGTNDDNQQKQANNNSAQ